MKFKKTFYQGIAALAVLIILAVNAGADAVPWSSKSYTAYAMTVIGSPDTVTDSQPPVSATDEVIIDPSTGIVFYAHSEVNSSSMLVDVREAGQATASFSGSYTANMPYFNFYYDLSDNFTSLTFNINIQDTTTPSSLFTYTSDASTDYGSFIVQTPVGHNISVDFYLDINDNSYIDDSSTLSYNMSTSVVPEPISSILFVTGGVLLVGRRYIKRRNGA